MTEFKELFYNGGSPAKSEIIIVGVNPLMQYIIDEPEFLADMLRVNKDLKITIIYESVTENFNQSLFYDKKLSKEKIEFDKLQRFREHLIGDDEKKKKIAGLLDTILTYFDKSERDDIVSRVMLKQNNLRHFVNLIIVDDLIRYAFTTLEIPTIDHYETITAESNPLLYKQLDDYVKFLLNDKSGGIFLSSPGDELIELYDIENIPRGIYPRKAFYSTEYQRYSIWAFIFNRKGELLMHKRSEYTADNRSLWDKSAGGHVDLKDSSTIITAKRELVEELFLPEAEFTKYMRAELGDIIDFGEWNSGKRPEKYFKSDFDALDLADWVVFRARDKMTKEPMTIRRKSPRIMHVADLDENGKKIPILDENGKQVIRANGKPAYKEHKEIWYTRFISDVYLFIAPEDYIDNEEQMHALMGVAEMKGAASAHKIISIEDLIADVEEHPEIYTDDIIYMVTENKWLLIQFAEFVKYIFKKN